ncbi:MAG: hypothetical protein JSR62_01440 [Nitrospira sp.]|nr:hypothetical protein [Nitrospira sp.]
MRKTSQVQPEFSCPDCIGVLRIETIEGHHRGYVCQVGHRFSPNSLLQAKEREFERAVWSAAVLLLHVLSANQAIVNEPRTPRSVSLALKRRAREATQQYRTLLRMVENTHAIS